MFEKAFKSVCTSTVVLPGLLPPTPSTSLVVMTPENEEDSEHPEPAYGDILTEYASD